MRKNGKYWTCATKRREVSDRWAKKNPDRVYANRHTVSEHHLTQFDAKAMIGECPICGSVPIVPWGRGYACAVRAKELRSVQEESIQRRCWKCLAWSSEYNPVDEDGVCQRCTDDLQPGNTLRGMYGRAHTTESLRQAAFYFECEEAGMHIGYPENPYYVDDFEVVPGWKTIGSPLPTRSG